MLKLDKNPKYQIIYFLFIFSLLSSDFILKIPVFGLHLFLGRILLFVIPVILFLNKRLIIFPSEAFPKNLFILLLCFFSWGLVSLGWAIDISLALKDIYYIFSGILVFIIIYSFYKLDAEFLNNFSITWFIILIGFFLFSWVEKIGEFHLKGNFTNFLQHFNYYHIPAHDSTIAVFGGPNEFSLYIVFSICFLSTLLLRSYKMLFFIIILFQGFLIIHENDSKISIIAFVLFLLLLLVTYFKYLLEKIKQYKNIVVLFLICVISMLGIILFNPSQKNTFKENAMYKNMKIDMQLFDFNNQTLLDTSKDELTSMQLRYNLILNGLYFTQKSYGMGVGAGNYEAQTIKHAKYRTNHLINPHNFFIEVLSEYGIIIFLMFLSFFAYLFYKHVIIFNTLSNLDENNQWLKSLGLIVVYLILCNGSSSFMSNSLNWIMLTFIALESQKTIHQITSR